MSEGLFSALIGALVAFAVMLLTQWMQARRAERIERGTVLGRLIIEVSNLRDASALSRSALGGDIAIWPLRNQLYVSRARLKELAAYEETWRFYKSVLNLRQWLRANPLPERAGRWPDEQWLAIRAYRDAIDRYGDWLIALLQETIDDERVSVSGRPSVPGLP
jgi:hypothetical protein